jgi:hypothetical protein
MKTWLRGAFTFVLLLSAAVVSAQNLAGNWQGTLQAGNRALRLVFVISAADGGGLRAVMYSIDQGGQGVPATVAVQGSAVRMNAAGINVTFEGSLSADGNSIQSAPSCSGRRRTRRGPSPSRRGRWRPTRRSPSKWPRSS